MEGVRKYHAKRKVGSSVRMCAYVCVHVCLCVHASVCVGRCMCVCAHKHVWCVFVCVYSVCARVLVVLLVCVFCNAFLCFFLLILFLMS